MEQNIKALFVIINAGHADTIIEIARSEGAKGATILNAKGSAPNAQVFEGITIDTDKEIILCLTDNATCIKIMASVKEKAGINSPAHGVCFSLPVDRVIGLKPQAD